MPESFDDLPAAPDGETPTNPLQVQHCANCGVSITAAPTVEHHGEPHRWRHAASRYRACNPGNPHSEWARP